MLTRYVDYTWLSVRTVGARIPGSQKDPRISVKMPESGNQIAFQITDLITLLLYFYVEFSCTWVSSNAHWYSLLSNDLQNV